MSDEEKKKDDKLEKTTGLYGEQDTRLYSTKGLFREVDKLLGIQNQHYADVKMSKANLIGQTTRQDCKDFAVIAFWDLHKTDVFNCSRFFIVPNPIKRIIKDQRGTLVNQVLFTSEHTKDIFFFWKGVKGVEKKLDISSSSLDNSIDSIADQAEL